MVCRATSRWLALGVAERFHSQGRSSGQVPLPSSMRARAETRRVAAARACPLRGGIAKEVAKVQLANRARNLERVVRGSRERGNARDLGDGEVKHASLHGGTHLLGLGEPLLALLGHDPLAKLDEGQLTDLQGMAQDGSATELS